MRYKITNKTGQAIQLGLKNHEGKVVSATLPARSTLMIEQHQMSQDVADKAARRFITYEEIHEGPPAPPLKAAAPVHAFPNVVKP